jgi:mono/diheme cytochrome c family protein
MNSVRPLLVMVFVAAASAGIAAMSACGPPLPPSKPLNELTQQEMAGYSVYQAHCARCHYANSSGSKQGPGLQAMFKQPYLQSGAPANDERVRVVILGGRNMMPAMRNELSEQDMEDLFAYLHTI